MREGSGVRLVSPELVGRDSELSTIAQLVASAAGGTGATLLLSGEAGLGKSALLSRTIDLGRRSGLRVLRADCVQLEIRRPFGPFLDALRPVRELPAAAAALAVAPDDGVEGGGADRYRTHAAFLRALASLAEERPILVAIDDLHWADDSSLELFAHLSRRLPRALLIGTYRPDEVSKRPALRRALGDLARDRLWDVPLSRLTATDVGRALRLILGQGAKVSAGAREALQARSAGNPLFLEETLRALAQRGELQRVDGTWRLGSMKEVPLPASIQDAVRERFQALDVTQRDLLVLAAVIGERFDLDLLARSSEVPERAILGTIRAAVAADLIVEIDDPEGDRFAFRHPLMRDAILDEVLHRERRDLHRRVAKAIEQHGIDEGALSALAHHFDQARELERAFDYHQRAGEHAARRFAHAEALAHFERALEIAPADDPTVGRLALRVSEMSSVLGRTKRTFTAAEEALRRWERVGDARRVGEALLAMQSASRKLLVPSSFGEGLVARAITVLEPLGDTPELSWAHEARAIRLAHKGLFDDALQHAELGVSIAERCEPSWQRSLALMRVGEINYALGRIDAAIGSHRRAVSAAEEPGTTRGIRMDFIAIGSFADLLGRLHVESDEHRYLKQRRLELRERYGVMQNDQILLHVLMCRPDWDEFIRLHEDRAVDLESDTVLSAHFAIHRAFVDAARSGPVALAAARAAHESLLRYDGPLEPSTSSVAEVAIVLGEQRMALDALESAAPYVSRPNALLPAMTSAGAYALIAARAASDRAAARTWIGRFEPPLRAPLDSINPVLHAYRYADAERAWEDGDRDAAIDGLASLVTQLMTLDIFGADPILTHFMALREVEMRVARGAVDDRERASARLGWVVDFYRKACAAWYLARLRERATGWALPFPSEAAVRTDGAALTGREREVARLVAKGMTNREIAEHLTLSVRTAESHVERIRSKLGFRTRAQVAAWAADAHGRPS